MGAVTEMAARSTASDRQIEGQGTPESAWQRWPALWATPATSLDAVVPPHARLVVVAPHPDDEIVGCGGLLSLIAARQREQAPAAQRSNEVLIIGVTDGDASHPGSALWTPDQLAAHRCEERLAGLERLGLRADVHRLALPDGHVQANEAALTRALRDALRPDDVVIATWRFDGHPDHEAVGRACAEAAAQCGATQWEMPVWTWHWAQPADPSVPWHRLRQLPISDHALADKRRALAAHGSQLTADGDRPAVLFPEAVDRLLRSAEFFFLPESPP